MLVPMQHHARPNCTSPAVSEITTRVRPFCVVLTGLCFLRVFVPLHFMESLLHFSAVVFVLVLAVSLARLAFALAFVLLAFAIVRAGLVFAFCRPCQTIQLFGYFASLRFSFDSDQFPLNFSSWLPVADKTIVTGCVFLRTNSTFSIPFD